MADEHGGQSSGFFGNALWLRLFTLFRIALDPKKLLLAGVGLLVMALGWWFLSVIFFSMRPTPLWSKYQEDLPKKASPEQKNVAWKQYQADRRKFAFLSYLAGYPTEGDAARNDRIADLAKDREVYQYAEKYANKLERADEKIEINKPDAVWYLKVGGNEYNIKGEEDELKALKTDDLRVRHIQPKIGHDDKIRIRTVDVTFLEQTNREKVVKYAEGAKTELELRTEIDRSQKNREKKRRALQIATTYGSLEPEQQQYGIYRTLPWFEDRGPNPFLMLKDQSGRRNLVSFFANDQLKVLLEPLYKFLSPVIFLFDTNAGGWNRVYLILIILWTLATWAFFGGAITRMAAVQIARPNEKVGLMEALRFVKDRYKSFLLAPLCPLIFILALTVFLIFFGWISGLTVFFGDIVVAGLFWPVVLIVGLIMAVVLVGLVGWPLMYATISAEGSDSFDALSRSYSYVYQAPWRYIWYGAVALAYGAILVFFVGLMGSLLVYMGKWGVSQTPFLASENPAMDREPSYLFYYAPTSFGWRDLLIEGSRFSEKTPAGNYQFTEEYRNELTWYNQWGAIFVSAWIYLLFLFVVGFGYSFFWSASTMIYLLLRHKVDDTDLDEVYLDDEEDPFLTEPPPLPTPSETGQQPTDGMTMVESPTLRAPEKPAEEAAPTESAPASESPPAEGEAPPSEPKKTMLMPTPGEETEDESEKAEEEKPEPAAEGEKEKSEPSGEEKQDTGDDEASKSESESGEEKKNEDKKD